MTQKKDLKKEVNHIYTKFPKAVKQAADQKLFKSQSKNNKSEDLSLCI